eukprot:364662-Chlamydomonas_euryale.AAC.4
MAPQAPHGPRGRSLSPLKQAILLLAAAAALMARGALAGRALKETFPAVAGYDAPLIDQDSPGYDLSFNDVSSVQQCADICTANTVSGRAQQEQAS